MIFEPDKHIIPSKITCAFGTPHVNLLFVPAIPYL